MSNILHEIKHGFLILGITGPLSSGCTTAANFFENSLDYYIDKSINNAIPKILTSINKLYTKLINYKQLLDLEQSELKKDKLYKKIFNFHTKLKEYLTLRETLTVLSEYRENKFIHISMTDMLIKLTIEHVYDKDENELDNRLIQFKKFITYDNIKLLKAIQISQQIKKRNFSAIDKYDIRIFEEYLQYISFYREEIKSKFDLHELGKILQDLGDNARRSGSPVDYETNFDKNNAQTLFVIAAEANDIIKFYRNKNRTEYGLTIPSKFVIEAFRNPYEVEYFRNRYYEFYLLSIFAHENTRKFRGNYSKERDDRDKGKNLKPKEFFKQNVSACVHLSDIAINNDTQSLQPFYRKLAKYFALICRPGCITPTDDELFMQQAYCMSLKSNCISRKVGAIIVGQRNYIIGAGWNDVGSGQIPCGYRRFSDISNNHHFPLAIQGEENQFSSFLKQSSNGYQEQSFCFKDEYSKYKMQQKVTNLLCNLGNEFNDWAKRNMISAEEITKLSDIASSNLSIKRLEYCRALHAEENAILQTAIIGGIGIEGSTIYTTTFPCELCAKKIYQSRIKKVVYTEPYPESISEDVFFKDGSHSVELLQFEGVKSYSYYRLFKSTIDKKEYQIQEQL